MGETQHGQAPGGGAGRTQEETGMTARETFKTKLTQLRQQSKQTGQVRLDRKSVV